MPYFDVNATAALHPAARQAWLEAADRTWHNPSSLFAAGTAARDLLDDSRERLADLLGCSAGRIVFTGGATEANNAWARFVGRAAPTAATALVSAIEHPCVADALHDALPGRVREIPVDRDGVVSGDALEEAVNAVAGGVAAVSVLAAGNESGVVQPWWELAERCRRHGIAFHTDAAQWLGKLPARGLGGCDWVTGSGHKFGGPKGVGFLVVPEGERRFHAALGGPQEAGRRAGTENVPAIAAMVAALEAREAEAEADPGRAARAADRDAAAERLLESLPRAVIVSGGARRLWNTLAVIVPGADGRRLVARLAEAGIEASTGAACSAGAGAPARILAAIGAAPLGVAEGDLKGMVRLSGGWDTTAAEWASAVDALAAAVHGLARSPPAIRL